MLYVTIKAFTNMKDDRSIFVHDNEECIETCQVQEKWYIKQRKGKIYIDREVDDCKIFVLQITYRRHKEEEDFHNTICHIKYRKSNKYERFFSCAD